MKMLFSLLLCLCGIIRVYGEEITKPQNMHFHFGADGFWSHGKFSASHVKWTNDFFLIGPRVELEIRKPDAFYFDAESVYALGKYHCVARMHDKSQKKKFHQSATWSKSDLGFGYTFQPSAVPTFLLSLYTGPGYFFRKIDFGKDRWFYWQFALKASQDWSNLFNLGIDMAADYAIAKNPFWGIEVGVPLTCYLGQSRKWDIRIKPYLLKLDLDSAETILGVRLEAGYSF